MQQSFDFVIVGAGSAGCVIADRLSESGRYSVLVLEAGPRDSNPWIHVPMGYGKTFFDQRINWCLSSEPSPELNGRRIYNPFGKVLGGSSSINGLVYARGQREDFDGWCAAGNPGWSFDDVLPFFRKSEKQQHGGNIFHGEHGRLEVSDVLDRHPLSTAFVASAQAAGFNFNPDFNGPVQEGVGPLQVTARGGRRSSSAAAFLRAAETRPKVCIKTHARVSRLEIQNGRITGVTYVQDGVTSSVQARFSVVLSAGAIHSPAILQRSGIGPAKWLKDAGIPVLHQLEGVGSNLQDHPQARLVLRSRHRATLNTQVRHPFHLARMGLQYALFRRGPLASSGGQTGGFLRSRPGLDRPDFMYFCMPFSSKDLREGLDRFPGFTIASVLLQPESRGVVRVKSGNPDEAPTIQPNYLDAPNDRLAMLAGLRTARRITSAGPFSSEIDVEERPGPGVQTDEDLLSYVRATATSGFHHCGTCKMGAGPDAVVDSSLRLHGLGGLTVADASIMPTIVSSGTNPASIMIGEKAAAFLLAAV